MFHRDSIPIDLFDEKNPTIKPNTRTYLDPVHADGISWWDEVKAMFISFSFVGIFYYFIILFIIGYYSKFARSILFGNAFLGNSLHVIVILDLVDPCKAARCQEAQKQALEPPLQILLIVFLAQK